MEDISFKAGRLVREYAENYMEKMFYFCLRKTGNSYDAEDLASDITLNVLSALNGKTIPEHFSAWVWQVARNRYYLWAKKKHRRSESVTGADIDDLEIEDQEPNALDRMIRQEDLASLRRELAFISFEYRNLIVAYYIENHSIKEIASTMHLPEGTVVSRLFRARKLLKEGMSMAREFGVLSYKPENIRFSKWGNDGKYGEPWTIINRTLAKNLILATYRTPSTVEELALELGIALPYMEDELRKLVDATLIRTNGNKYESNVVIVSAAAQERIDTHVASIAPKLTEAVIHAAEYWIACQKENGGVWHEGYQSYEDMKWTVLMRALDEFSGQSTAEYDQLYPKHSPNQIAENGRTVRPNGGAWDLIGFEESGRKGVAGIGHHTIAGGLDFPGFGHYRYGYRNIEGESVKYITREEGNALFALVKGDGNADKMTVEHLVNYGFLKKNDIGYVPTFWVMKKEKLKPMTEAQLAEYERLTKVATELILANDIFRRGVICSEIPDFMQDDAYIIDFSCIAAYGNVRGYVLEEALRQGYLQYNPAGDHRMFGAYMVI